MLDDAPPTLTIDDTVATVMLNRPGRRNRLADEDLDALLEAFAQVDANAGLRVLVLAARGPVFCAGYDLAALAGDSHGGPQRFEAVVQALQGLAVPTVARLHGGVYGGATDLALACDFRVGVDTMELRMPAARIGLHYSGGGLARFAAKLGLAAAKRIVLAAPTLDAAELERIGYLDERVAAPDLDAAIARWCAALANGAPLAVQGMKRTLDEWAAGRPDADAVRDRVARCASSDDLREGLAALRERREPRFTGR
jgi:enoyl-CoA hydratase/carnithine racemase